MPPNPFVGQVVVEQDDVGAAFTKTLHGFREIASFGDHFQVGFGIEKHAEHHADEEVVVQLTGNCFSGRPRPDRRRVAQGSGGRGSVAMIRFGFPYIVWTALTRTKSWAGMVPLAVAVTLVVPATGSFKIGVMVTVVAPTVPGACQFSRSVDHS